MTREEIIQAIKEMTVLELNELVTACEEEFGVSAAAPVAVAGGAVAGAAAEEKTEFDVVLACTYFKFRYLHFSLPPCFVLYNCNDR